jgi:hypothetical protein
LLFLEVIKVNEVEPPVKLVASPADVDIAERAVPDVPEQRLD